MLPPTARVREHCNGHTRRPREKIEQHRLFACFYGIAENTVLYRRI
jgi:hypothetical protein